MRTAKHAAYFFKTSESSSGVEKARNFSLHHSADIQLSFALTGYVDFGSYLEIYAFRIRLWQVVLSVGGRFTFSFMGRESNKLHLLSQICDSLAG